MTLSLWPDGGKGSREVGSYKKVESARFGNSTAFLYLLEEASLADCLDGERSIYYLRGMAEYNRDVHSIDLPGHGAKLLQVNPLVE